MKIFIWENVDKCSDNYHEDGGVVVVAEDETAARALANERAGCAIRPDEPVSAEFLLDGVTDTAVYIFPDAGCC